jgi:hypothetical protein
VSRTWNGARSSEPSPLDLRHVENVVDDREQGLARGLGGVQIVALLGRQRRLQREVRHADHGVQRRADLVAHVGEELALGSRCPLGALACDVQLLDELCQTLVGLLLLLLGALHLTGVPPERVLGALAIGDVASGRVDQPLVRVGRGIPLEPLARAVLRQVPVLEIADVLAAHESRHRGLGPLPIVRMDELEEWRAPELRLGVTQHLLPGRVQPDEEAVEAGDAEEVERQREEAVQLLGHPLALRERGNLSCGGSNRGQELRRWIAGLGGEEFHHPHHRRALHDGDGKGGMQSRAAGK